MKKIVYLWTFLFSTALSSLFPITDQKIFFYGTIGGVYTEDFFTLIYQTQASPYLETGAGYSFRYNRFTIAQELFLNGYAFNRYIKNHLLYYTDKTVSVDASINYRLYCSYDTNFFIEPVWGAGFSLLSRYDVYSLGPLYHYAEQRLMPCPLLLSGFSLAFFNVFTATCTDELGGSAGFKNIYLQDEFERTDHDWVIMNQLAVETRIKVTRKNYLLFGWHNRLLVTLDMLDIVGRAFWSNYFYTGVKCEL